MLAECLHQSHRRPDTKVLSVIAASLDALLLQQRNWQKRKKNTRAVMYLSPTRPRTASSGTKPGMLWWGSTRHRPRHTLVLWAVWEVAEPTEGQRDRGSCV